MTEYSQQIKWKNKNKNIAKVSFPKYKKNIVKVTM